MLFRFFIKKPTSAVKWIQVRALRPEISSRSLAERESKHITKCKVMQSLPDWCKALPTARAAEQRLWSPHAKVLTYPKVPLHLKTINKSLRRAFVNIKIKHGRRAALN